MSIPKNRKEAMRWLKTAKSDLESAGILHLSRKYSTCCFLCQQAVEKAFKAIHFLHDRDGWGHSIFLLLEDMESFDLDSFNKLKKFSQVALELDRLYIPTRYPNGLPDLIPDEAYSCEDAEDSLEKAHDIIEAIAEIIS